MLKFVCPLIVVEDIARSRQFCGDFAIHLETHFQQLFGEPTGYPVVPNAHEIA